MKTSDFDHRVHTVKHRGVLDTPDRTGRIDAQTRALYERQQIEKHDEAEGRKVLALYNAVIRALDEHDQNWRAHRDIDKGEGIEVAAGRTIRYMSEAIAMLKKDKLDREASFAAIREARAQYQRPPKAITYFALPDHDRPVEQFEWSVAGQPVPQKWRCGLLFRPGSLWVGAHWAGHNKRLCLNLIPMVTFWVTLPGGVPPRPTSGS